MPITQNTPQAADIDTRKKTIYQYQPDAKRLIRYISWLEKSGGSSLMNSYEGEGALKTSFTFPVYDSTLLSFVKTAKETRFITRNYQYVYTRNRIRSTEQEKKFIQAATLKDMDNLSGILSRYVLGGMTKSTLWAQGVQNGVYLEILYKLRELLVINTQ